MKTAIGEVATVGLAGCIRLENMSIVQPEDVGIFQVKFTGGRWNTQWQAINGKLNCEFLDESDLDFNFQQNSKSETHSPPSPYKPDYSQPDEPQLKSYVWHKPTRKCFFVSTIERDSSACVGPPPMRFHETIAWEFDWKANKKGEMIAQTGDGNTFTQHTDVCRQLFWNGTWKDERDE